jgi:4-hydroxy-2-oxoheptanedioate aldolase
MMRGSPVNARSSARLLAGETQLGLWLSIGEPGDGGGAVACSASTGCCSTASMPPIEIASDAAAVAGGGRRARPKRDRRAPGLERQGADQEDVLDMGAQTLLVPFVETPEEAAAAVAATRYPPKGLRGVAGATRASRYGLTSDYFAVSDDEIAVLVQIETTNALARLEEIAAVPGVDGVFIGPSDLSASMGFLGRAGAPEVQAVLEDAARRIVATGKAPGILATNAADAVRYRHWGYRFIAGAVDLGLLVKAAQGVLKDLADG